MKKIKLVLLSLGLIFSLGLAILPATTSYAANNPLGEACENNPDTTICKHQNDANYQKVITNIVNTLLFGVGVVSVFMIIFAGIRYASSMGDAGNITKAKNTLLYAIIGLIVSILAYAIVNWVVGVLK